MFLHTRPWCRKIALAATVSVSLVFLAAQLPAQSRQGGSLRGEIVAHNGALVGDLTAELRKLAGQTSVGREVVAADGRFSFEDLAVGDYELSLTDRAGNLVARQFVTVQDIGTYVEIRLPEVKVDRPVSGTVSVAQLRRKIPPMALKEFRKAVEARQKGDLEASMQHLQRAIALEPAYMEARNNLGAHYLRLEQHDKAIEQFQTAAELDSGSAPVFGNLAVALSAAGRLPEAEQAARHAVRLDSKSNKSRYVLGAILNAERKDDAEALANLRTAAREIPQARLAAAEVLIRDNNRTGAVAELKKYLESGTTADREQVESWLAKLGAP